MFLKFSPLCTTLAVAFLLKAQPVLFAQSGGEFDARIYWDHAEQRPGQTEVLFLRLEADAIPDGPLAVRLTPPPGANVETDNTGWLQSIWNKVSGQNTGLDRKVETSDWKRGVVVSNSVKNYFTYRALPEKHLSATTSWKIRCPQPLDGQGTVEISTPGREAIQLPVCFDFRKRPEPTSSGQIPPPVPASHDYLVGALYYPGWEPGQGSGWNLLNPFPERKPALGYYDGASVDTANWEIKWALENGINFFVYCWYAPLGNKKLDPTNLFLGRALHDGLLKSPFLDQFKFAVLWENDVSGNVSRGPLLQDFLPFWIQNYFKNPGYLVVEGKPVLFIYNVANFIHAQGGPEEAKETVRLMREAVQAAGFQGLWLAGEYRRTDKTPLQTMGDIGLDASFPYCYNFDKPARNQTALDAIEEVARVQDQISPVPVIATISPSWDPKPWIDYIDYPWHRTAFWLDPDSFKKGVQWMKARIDARPGNNPLAKRMLLIDNWNEYGEGHWVAPSRKEGFRYLNAIRDVFAPQSAGHPNILPEDVALTPDESAYQKWIEKTTAKP